MINFANPDKTVKDLRIRLHKIAQVDLNNDQRIKLAHKACEIIVKDKATWMIEITPKHELLTTLFTGCHSYKMREAIKEITS